MCWIGTGRRGESRQLQGSRLKVKVVDHPPAHPRARPPQEGGVHGRLIAGASPAGDGPFDFSWNRHQESCYGQRPHGLGGGRCVRFLGGM